MESTELQRRKREEYEMQLFGFHSRAVYATLKGIVVDRIQSKSKKLCETLEKMCKLNTENSAILKLNKEQLMKAYYTAALPYLKNIENTVNKFITVPSHVLSEEDKLQEIQYTETEFEALKKKLDNIQQRAKRATMLNAALKEELQFIEQFSISADNIDRLNHVMEDSVVSSDISNKIFQLVNDYKELSSSINNGIPVSQKSLYNTIDDLKCIDYDMDNL